MVHAKTAFTINKMMFIFWLYFGLVYVSHHRSVDGVDAVVTHVQRGQVPPQRNDSCDRAARLRSLCLPLRDLTCLWDKNWLEAVGTHHMFSTEHTKHLLTDLVLCRCSMYHHGFHGVVNTQSSKTWPQRRQTLNLLSAAITDLRTEEETGVYLPILNVKIKCYCFIVVLDGGGRCCCWQNAKMSV